MKSLTFALALAVMACATSSAFAATVTAAKHPHSSKMMKVSAKAHAPKYDGDAAVAKLNQQQLDQIKAGK